MSVAPPATTQTATPSFIERQISVQFDLGVPPTANVQPTFPGTQSTSVTVSNLRTVVHIVKAGGQGMSNAEITIRGMTLAVMNQLSTLGVLLNGINFNNVVTVMAGDAVNGMAMVFQGTIQAAWIDFGGAPDVVFNVTASSGLGQAMKAVAGTSFTGPTDAAVALAGMAKAMGLAFENNSNLSSILQSPCFPSTGRAQAYACANAAGWAITIDNGTLAIWPKTGSRQAPGAAPALLSPGTDLIGYPSYTAAGIVFKTLFNPSLVFGGQVSLKNAPSIQLPQTEGIWNIVAIVYDLEAQMPGGEWFCTINASRNEYVQQPG